MKLQMNCRVDKLIEVKDVTVKFDCNAVLDAVSLRVDNGDFMAITGPNGGGKTTLLRVILKLLKPNSGSVCYYDSAGMPTDRLAIGYLPQKSMIDTRFPITVREVVMSGFLGIRYSKSEIQDRFDEIVSLTGIGNYINRPIGVLSGGQLQRTLLGRALISDPDVVVLDEPLSYVDKAFERKIYSIIEDIARKSTVILVSHEMSIISGMANRHIIVDHGLHECNALHHYVPSDCC